MNSDERDVRTMVAVWPHISPHSDHYDDLRARGLLVTTATDKPAVFSFADRAFREGLDVALLDLSNPEARRWIWDRVSEHHLGVGVRTFWLDACEPELTGDGMNPHEADARFSVGHGTTWSSMFPLWDVRAIHEGLDQAPARPTPCLARPVGMGRLAALRSRDVARRLPNRTGTGSPAAGAGRTRHDDERHGVVEHRRRRLLFLSDPDSDDFRELLVRWFKFATVLAAPASPRQSAARLLRGGDLLTGRPQRDLVVRAQVEAHLTGLLHFRNRLRPYLHRQLDLTATTGTAPIRPMWYEFPHDEAAITVDDQFTLGSDLLVAPIAEYGAREREVYLPAGRRWRDIWSAVIHDGGQTITVPAPLGQIPVFEIEGGDLGVDASWFDTPTTMAAE